MWPCSSASTMLQQRQQHGAVIMPPPPPPPSITNNHADLVGGPHHNVMNLNATNGGSNSGNSLFNRGSALQQHGGLLDDPLFGLAAANNFMQAPPPSLNSHQPQRSAHNPFGGPGGPYSNGHETGPPSMYNASGHHHGYNKTPAAFQHPHAPPHHQMQQQQQPQWNSHHSSGGSSGTGFNRSNSGTAAPQHHNPGFGGGGGLKNGLFPPFGGGPPEHGIHHGAQQPKQQQFGLLGLQNFNPQQQESGNQQVQGASLNNGPPPPATKINCANSSNSQLQAAQKISELRTLMENVGTGVPRGQHSNYEGNAWTAREQQFLQQQQRNAQHNQQFGNLGGPKPTPLDNGSGNGGKINFGGGSNRGMMMDGTNANNYLDHETGQRGMMTQPFQGREGEGGADDNHFFFAPPPPPNNNYNGNNSNNNNNNRGRFGSYRSAATNNSNGNADDATESDDIERSSISGRSGTSTVGTGNGAGAGNNSNPNYFNPSMTQIPSHLSSDGGGGSSIWQQGGSGPNKYNSGNGQGDHQIFNQPPCNDHPSSSSTSSRGDVNGTSVWAAAMFAPNASNISGDPLLPRGNREDGIRGGIMMQGGGSKGGGCGSADGGSTNTTRDCGSGNGKDSLLYDDEFIKRVVNTPTNWGKVPVKQDAAWEHHSESPEPDACTIGTQIWKSSDSPSMGVGLDRMLGSQSLIPSGQSYGMWKGDNEINQWHNDAPSSAHTGANNSSLGNCMGTKDNKESSYPGGDGCGDTWNRGSPNTNTWNQFSDTPTALAPNDYPGGGPKLSQIVMSNKSLGITSNHPSSGTGLKNVGIDINQQQHHNSFLMQGVGGSSNAQSNSNNSNSNFTNHQGGYGALKSLVSPEDKNNSSFFGGDWPSALSSSTTHLHNNATTELSSSASSSSARAFNPNNNASGGGNGNDWLQPNNGGNQHQSSGLVGAAFKAVGSMIVGGGGDKVSALSSFGDGSGDNGNNPFKHAHNDNLSTGHSTYNSGNNGGTSNSNYGGDGLGGGSGKIFLQRKYSEATARTDEDDDDEDGGGIGVWKSVEAAKQESSMYWNSNMVNSMEPGESQSVLGPPNPPPPLTQHQHHPMLSSTKPNGPPGPFKGNLHHHGAGGWGEFDSENSVVSSLPHPPPDASSSHGQQNGNFDDGTSIWAQNTNSQNGSNQLSTNSAPYKNEKPPSFPSHTWANDFSKDHSAESPQSNSWMSNNKEVKDSDMSKSLWSNSANNGQIKNNGSGVNKNWPTYPNSSMKPPSDNYQMLGFIKEDIESLLTKNHSYQQNIGNNNYNANTSSLEMLNGGCGNSSLNQALAALGAHKVNNNDNNNNNNNQTFQSQQQRSPYDNNNNGAGCHLGSPGPMDGKTDASHILQMMGKQIGSSGTNTQINSRNLLRQQTASENSSISANQNNNPSVQQNFSSLNMPSINNNSLNALNSKMLQLHKNLSPAQLHSNQNHPMTNNAMPSNNNNLNNNNNSNNSIPTNAPQHNTSLISQQLDQLNMAISSGLINPHILNLKLSPQILVMLQQLLNYHKILQTMQVQQQTLMNKKGLNIQLQRQQLEHLQSKIDQVRQQILQLQNNIALATQPNVPTTTSPNTNSNQQDVAEQQPEQTSVVPDTQSSLYGDNLASADPVSPTYQKSRLQQWKLPSPEKGSGDAGNSVQTIDNSTGAVKGTVLVNATSSKASVSSETSSKSELNIAEFEPGKPWSGFKNVENDPYITPGSLAARNQMTLNSLKDSEVFNSLDSSSTAMGLPEDGHHSSHINPSSLYPHSGENEAKELEQWHGILNSAGIGESADAITSPSSYNVQSSNFGNGQRPTSNSQYRPSSSTTSVMGKPPPQLNTMNPGGSFAASLAGKLKTNLNNGSAQGSNPANILGNKFGMGAMAQQQQTWKGYPSENSAFNSVYGANKMEKATWLVMKNLTPQVDGSTLKTLCQQHGPLQHFYLNRSTGSALALYTSWEEANRAQRSLHSVVLWNAPIHAETAPYETFPHPLPPQQQQPFHHMQQQNQPILPPPPSSNNPRYYQ